MRTISIKGVGKAKRDPDLVIFRISTETREKEYADSIEESNKLVNQLKDDFESIGFKREDLKTVYFNTRQVYDTVEIGLINKKHERQLQYFEVEHNLRVEFDLDNDKINQVLKFLKNFNDKLTFEIQFSVKDKEAMKKDVILDATKKAKFNAEILAEASSVKLGDLIKIEYDWVDINFNSMSNYNLKPNFFGAECDDYMEFTPDSIEIVDSVAFVWEIK